ncbi:hypothetical protein SAMN04488244_103271 [Vibrio hangzhouensis]|uniref:Hemolysin n=1 Tax=Vibrio hangzhouensis TaxID=462991 RepID=A0A1H5UPW1_9VIBR|nr:hypothetical protein SAMN04488244_103271 [Vibrio hangzhouensis]
MKTLALIGILTTILVSPMTYASNGNGSGGGKVFGNAVQCQLRSGKVEYIPRTMCEVYRGTVIQS